jgi:DNA-binding response OmpR family regulator
MDVLIVDDDVSVRESEKRILERAGFDVETAGNGLAAFAELQQRSFSAMVCDIRMPFLDGKSFYEQVEEFFPDIANRTVFVTGFSSEDDTRQFLESSGQPFLEKPVELVDLVNAVRKMVEKG